MYVTRAVVVLHTEARTIDWFNHYLRGENASGENHDGMPAGVVYQDETGAFHGIGTFPTPDAPGMRDRARIVSRCRSFSVSRLMAGCLLASPVPHATASALTASHK